MAQTRWNFTVGADGDACTTTNTGSDFVATTGGTAVLSDDQPYISTLSALLTATTTSGGVYLQKSLTVSGGLAVDMYVYLTAAPSGAVFPIAFFATSTRQVSLELLTDRKIQIRDAGSTVIWTSTASIPLNTWTRVALYAVQNATTGQVRAAIFNGHDTTPISGGDSGLLTGRNTGASAFNTVRLGVKSTTGTQTVAGHIGSYAYDPAATGLTTPVSTAPPTITPLTAVNTTVGATVSMTVSASADTPISSYAWTVLPGESTATPTLTGAATPTVSFTAPGAGLVVLQVTVTASSGGSSSASGEVRISGSPPARPLALDGASVGAWTVTGASTGGAALADESDATYVESPTLTVTETSRRQRLTPVGALSDGSLALRLWTDTSTATVEVRLKEGATVRQTWSQALTSTPTEFTFTLASGTITAISDWANLWAEVAATS